MRPCRDNRVSSNSSPAHAGLRQKKDALGKKTVPHVVHLLPSSDGSSSMVNQPSIAGARVTFVVSDTPSDYSRTALSGESHAADRPRRLCRLRHPAAGAGTEQVLRGAVGARGRAG